MAEIEMNRVWRRIEVRPNWVALEATKSDIGRLLKDEGEGGTGKGLSASLRALLVTRYH
jgi:hypothetical protein